MKQGPPIEHLTRRLAETPGEFKIHPGRELHFTAVISDLLFNMGGEFLQPGEVDFFDALGKKNEKLAGMILILCHLLWDRWFREQKAFSRGVLKFFKAPFLKKLSALITPENFIEEPERREELARLTLKFLGLCPGGEKENYAKDRLVTLDSVQRHKLILKTREARKRAKKLQEEMARKQAEEAASKMMRE